MYCIYIYIYVYTYIYTVISSLTSIIIYNNAEDIRHTEFLN